jgi:LysE type translocator
MNAELFAAFVLITVVLILTPGPIVTLVIATGATQGVRAALTTVAGTTLGNTFLLAAIAFGLNWVLKNATVLFEVLRCLSRLARHPGLAGRWNEQQSRRAWRPGQFCARRAGRGVEPEDDCVFHGFPAAVYRSRSAGGAPARRHVHRLSVARGRDRLCLGRCRRPWPRMVPKASASQAARAALGQHADRRWNLAVAGATAQLAVSVQQPRKLKVAG